MEDQIEGHCASDSVKAVIQKYERGWNHQSVLKRWRQHFMNMYLLASNTDIYELFLLEFCFLLLDLQQY